MTNTPRSEVALPHMRRLHEMCKNNEYIPARLLLRVSEAISDLFITSGGSEEGREIINQQLQHLQYASSMSRHSDIIDACFIAKAITVLLRFKK